MNLKNKKLQLSFNSPVILGFIFASFFVVILDAITKGGSTVAFFSVYRSSPLNTLAYIRILGHGRGHEGLKNFFGKNIMILFVGRLLEEKYGSANILFIILATALITGIVHITFFPYVRLLGASGVVFAFILLSSITSFGEGKIPLTFILVALLYIGEQIYDGLFINDNISNLTHIIGGIVGSSLGYIMNKDKRRIL